MIRHLLPAIVCLAVVWAATLLTGCAIAAAAPQKAVATSAYQSDAADRTGWATCFPDDCWEPPSPV